MKIAYVKNREKWSLISSETIKWYFLSPGIFTECGKALVLNFLKIGNTVFFLSKKFMQGNIFFSVEYYLCWLLKSYYFELFGDVKDGLFLIKKVDEKVMLTWYFSLFQVTIDFPLFLFDFWWYYRTGKLLVQPKKWSFLIRIFSVNAAKSAGNCGFGHIYWRDP